MAKISKETSLCISIAQKPSNFGTTVFNEAFEATGADYLYKACRLKPNEDSLSAAIAGIRAIGIRGCGVSMPFKVMAIKYMDELDESARLVGALNTISNEDGTLKGYNTDYHGSLEALASIENIENKSVLLLGSGGVSMAILAALKSHGVKDVLIANKTIQKAQDLANKWEYQVVPWESRNEVVANLLINATSVGMQPDTDAMPIESRSIANFDTVYDVVISPVMTRLLSEAQNQGRIIIPGSVMCLHQAAAQYQIYTGTQAPTEVMEMAMNKLLNL